MRFTIEDVREAEDQETLECSPEKTAAYFIGRWRADALATSGGHCPELRTSYAAIKANGSEYKVQSTH